MCSFFSNLYNKRKAGAVFVFSLLTDEPSVYHPGFLREATLPLNPNWFIIRTVRVIDELFIYVESYRLNMDHSGEGKREAIINVSLCC